MKKVAFILILLLSIGFMASAQVTEQVNFDNYVSATNNDLTHHFYPYGGSTTFLHTQLTDSGITGGSLKAPLSQTPASNTAYCSKYKNVTGHTNTTSICFFWDTTHVNPSTTDYGVAIWTFPRSDASHDIHVSVSKNIGFEIRANGVPQTAGISGLISGHWYKLVFNAIIAGGSFGDSVVAQAQIYELGTTGMLTASLVQTVTETVHDITYATDTAVAVAIQGSKWGGVTYMDSFSFSGYKSADSCIVPTAINNISQTKEGLSIFPNPANGQATISCILPANTTEGTLVVRDVNGRTVKVFTINNSVTALDVDCVDLPSGVYYCCLQTERVRATAKMVIIR